MGWIKGLSLVGLVASHTTFFMTFVEAYLTDEKAIKVYINHYGEATLELILLTFFSVIILVWFYQMHKARCKK